MLYAIYVTKQDFEDNIYWQLLSVLIAVKHKLAPTLEKYHITGIQAHILILLSLDGSKPMSFLAEALRCDASNITSLVDKLELLGLIERRADPADRRIKMLFLTAKGDQVYRQLIDDINALEKKSLKDNHLSKTTVAEALAVLQKLV